MPGAAAWRRPSLERPDAVSRPQQAVRLPGDVDEVALDWGLRLARVQAPVARQEAGVPLADRDLNTRKPLPTPGHAADVVPVGVGERDTPQLRSGLREQAGDVRGGRRHGAVDQGQTVVFYHQVAVHGEDEGIPRELDQTGSVADGFHPLTLVSCPKARGHIAAPDAPAGGGGR